ncbi:N-alpha-acetyltransferase 38, NatC auxiliary subunit [Umbelopsis sp. PMI_123]|nr:N-alpha-acetyltransferase 38, NatC auxiliary subunit [Umbelopsis sp. PMI_123]
MSILNSFVDKFVSVITLDGRVIVGTARGVDSTGNIILEKCHERVFSPEGTEIVPLGLYVVRGDSVSIIGQIDTDAEAEMNIEELRAEPLSATIL